MLFLAGTNPEVHNIHERNARYRMWKGLLKRLGRGIYVYADQSEKSCAEEIRANALRVAKALCGDSYLSMISAITLKPTETGVLFVSGVGPSIELPGLNIIRTGRLPKPETEMVEVSDGMGRIKVARVSWPLAILECFRRDIPCGLSELSKSVIHDLIVSCVASHGMSRDKFLDICLKYAHDNFLRDEYEALSARTEILPDLQEKDETAIPKSTYVHFYGRPCGILVHREGRGYDFVPENNWGEELSGIRPRGAEMPPFIAALRPEGWLETLLGLDSRHPAAVMATSPQRFMNNITLSGSRSVSAPIDVILKRLRHYTANHEFAGKMNLPHLKDIAREFRQKLQDKECVIPRISGAQPKLPMTLDMDGELRLAEKGPFTHILKIPNPNLEKYSILPAAEWFGLLACRMAGIRTGEFALVEMDGGPPGLLIERFDIPDRLNANRRYMLVEASTGMRLAKDGIFDTSYEEVAWWVSRNVSRWECDRRTLLRQLVVSWLIGNGDMHAKNIGVLRKANADGARKFVSSSLAPAYDMLCTQCVPGFNHPFQAMPLRGKKTDWTATD